MAQMEKEVSLGELIYGVGTKDVLSSARGSKNDLGHKKRYCSSDINPISNEMRTGTTICAITYKDGVIIGADSRSSAGTYVANRLTDKLHPLTDNIFVLRSGASAHTQNIADYVSHFLNSQSQELDCQESRVKSAAKLVSSICYNNKKWVSASIIIAGYDSTDKGSIYVCPLGATLAEKVPFAIGGSGSAYIYGFCDRYFKPNMEKDEALAFLRKGLLLLLLLFFVCLLFVDLLFFVFFFISCITCYSSRWIIRWCCTNMCHEQRWKL